MAVVVGPYVLIGTSAWKNVIKRCIHNRYEPVLRFIISVNHVSRDCSFLTSGTLLDMRDLVT